MTSAASSVLFAREFGALSQRVRCCFPASSVFALIDEGGAGGAGAGAGARTRGGPPRGEGIWPRGRELLAGKRHGASPRAFRFPTGISLSDERSRVRPPLRTAPSFTPARADIPRTSADQRATSTELTSEQHRSRGETAPKSRGDPHHTPISSQQERQPAHRRSACRNQSWVSFTPANSVIGAPGPTSSRVSRQERRARACRRPRSARPPRWGGCPPIGFTRGRPRQ